MYFQSKLDRRLTQLQNALIDQTLSVFGNDCVPQNLKTAFYETPRHTFVHRFQSHESGEWINLTADNLSEHLTSLYLDRPISIYRNERGELVSTVSQPSLVLFMIHLLELQPGQRIIELGGGSGWHSAIMAQLVGPTGSVDSIEIIEDLVEPARQSAQSLQLDNLHFHHADGTQGYSERAPFDCGVFTASTPELPPVFFDQIKQEGLLEFVLKLPNHHDLFTLLRHKGDSFQSELLMPCSFVPVTGKQTAQHDEVTVLEELPHWQDLRQNSPTSINWYDLEIHSSEVEAFLHFCNNTLNDFHHFDSFDDEELRSSTYLSGLIDPDTDGIVLLNDTSILTYGTTNLAQKIKTHTREWIDAGKPNTEDLHLEIFPAHSKVSRSPNSIQWIYRMPTCTYRWSPIPE